MSHRDTSNESTTYVFIHKQDGYRQFLILKKYLSTSVIVVRDIIIQYYLEADRLLLLLEANSSDDGR